MSVVNVVYLRDIGTAVGLYDDVAANQYIAIGSSYANPS